MLVNFLAFSVSVGYIVHMWPGAPHLMTSYILARSCLTTALAISSNHWEPD